MDIALLLKEIADLWLKQIERAEKKKAADFGDTAREIMRYVGKRYNAIPMRKEGETVSQGDLQGPTPYTTYLNYTQGFIDIMTPYVFAQVPNRLVKPRRPQVPPELENAIPQIVAMQAEIRKQDSLTSFQLQWFLNWTPNEYDLKTTGMIAVQEALSKGRGCLWLEMVDGPFGPIPGSFDDSVDNLLIDPDCKKLREAGWICRKREAPIWRISKMFGEDADKLRASKKSNWKHAADEANANTENKGDIGAYYEFWSVMGIGDKFVGASQEMKDAHEAFDKLGPYAHFCVMEGVDHPLGMRPEIYTSASTPEEMAQLFAASLEWPIKTYEVTYNPWPLFCLDPKPQADKPWPKAILEAALPLQVFLDRIYTTLIHRAATAGRDICLTSADIEEAVENALKSLNDLEIIKVPSDVNQEIIEKMVNFIRFPEVKKDLFMILQIVTQAFREITGMTSALFGEIPKTQDRSAQATHVREAGISRRPDDYADKVEAWMSAASAGEAIAARLLVDESTVAPLFGESALVMIDPNTGKENYGNCPLTSLWTKYVRTDDPAIAAAECSYTVEAGSGRRKNKALLKETATQMYQMLSPVLQALGESAGQWEPYFALMASMGEAFDMALEPVIEKFKEALARGNQAAPGAPAAPGAQSQPQPVRE